MSVLPSVVARRSSCLGRCVFWAFAVISVCLNLIGIWWGGNLLAKRIFIARNASEENRAEGGYGGRRLLFQGGFIKGYRENGDVDGWSFHQRQGTNEVCNMLGYSHGVGTNGVVFMSDMSRTVCFISDGMCTGWIYDDEWKCSSVFFLYNSRVGFYDKSGDGRLKRAPANLVATCIDHMRTGVGESAR